MTKKLRDRILIGFGAAVLGGIVVWSWGAPQTEEEAWVRKRYNAKVTYDEVPKVRPRAAPAREPGTLQLTPEQRRVRDLFPELDTSAKQLRLEKPPSSTAL